MNNYHGNIQNGSDDHLEHYGIKGMKWGVRRSPEQLRKSRMSKLKDQAKSFGRKTANDPDSPEAAKKKQLQAKAKANRSTDSLTNAELQHVIQRMNLERQYATLNQSKTSQIKNNGKDFAQGIIKETAKATISKKFKDRIADQIEYKQAINAEATTLDFEKWQKQKIQKKYNK